MARQAMTRSDDEMQKFHMNTLVLDALGGALVPMPPVEAGRTAIDRWKEAGLNALHVTVVARYASFDETIRALYLHHSALEMHGPQLFLVKRAGDLRRAQQEGRLGVILGFQGASPMGDDLTNLTIFHRLGVRVIALTYMERNLLGDGCLEPENLGLTHLGRQAVREMNRLGIVVDLSHVGERTSLDAASISDGPVVLTHSNARSLCDHPRNASDELIRAVAAKGGVIGLTPYAPILSPTSSLGTRSTMQDLLTQVEHVVDLVGIDHVGIGTDMFEAKGATEWNATTKRRYPESVSAYEYENLRTVGFESLDKWPALTAHLFQAGYSDADVSKILGGNWERAFNHIWNRGPDF